MATVQSLEFELSDCTHWEFMIPSQVQTTKRKSVHRERLDDDDDYDYNNDDDDDGDGDGEGDDDVDKVISIIQPITQFIDYFTSFVC